MRRFLNKLVGDFRSTPAAGTARRAPRRASLQVEGLEDRLVLTSASFNPLTSTLVVNASPGSFGIIGRGIVIPPSVRQITLQSDPLRARLQVLDDGALVSVFENGVPVPGKEIPIASIKNVQVNLAFLDAVTVNYSNVLPFAAGTTITMSASGSFNSLSLTGSRIVSGGETYVAGNGAQAAASLTLGGSTYRFSSAVGPVTDTVKTTAPLIVKAFGSNVTLSGSNGVTQTLSSLSNGGAGDSLTYGNKNLVNLELFSASATASLNATAAAAGEHFFVTDLFGSHEAAQVNATPSAVDNSIVAAGLGDSVAVAANSGRVFINGSSSTFARLGTGIGGVTSGIKQDVFVSGVNTLVLDDSGNHTTPENVRVTESTISGTGLFGNNAAVVHYSDTGHLQILTGTAADTYAVRGSKPGAHFDSSIEIDDDFAAGGLNVGVAVDAGSGLHLHLDAFFTTIFVKGQLAPATQPPVSLSLFGLHGRYSQPTPTLPDGDETVTFAGGLTSDVSYQGFTSVSLANPNGTGGPLP
jgi:hypothetical protein